MKDSRNSETLIRLWLEKATDTLAAVPVLVREGFYSSAVNRLYYACFYAVTALLLRDGKQFSKHSTILAEFNRCYVKEGKIEKHWSRFLKDLFQDRQESDYLPTVTFEEAQIQQRLEQAEEFIISIRNLIGLSKN